MIDGSIDHGLEQNLVMYSTYIDLKGLGPTILQFMKLNSVFDGNRKTLYDIVASLRNKTNEK
jgi:hypothetical protein